MKQTKPQPLDFEEIKDIIDSLTDFDKWLESGGFKQIREEVYNKIKQRLKQACEFYLRYKDNPELLIREHPEYSNCEVSKSIGTLKRLIEFQEWDTGGEIDEILLDEKEYNEWLFKLAFKDVDVLENE